MGNGAKAQQKQQRNAKKAADAGPKRRVNSSCGELKTNEAAKSIICQTCRQSFVSLKVISKLVLILMVYFQLTTTRLPALTQHVENKHSGKTMADCFPNYKE
ncbi:zf-met2 domain-containing protein [Rhizoctonia solani AG-1 IA]|uniref:Zf-met2 domain-containing protein n=1 Tax=Thanatephorus cucumeris (strain AG1-IA) TaxID=983506 RepID=L8X2U9_THACA|nr:zf-met2 domain-containing protein [Rhizoctonia solani AG-1 IA]